MALVRITQERSKIRCIEKHKRTLAALGLRRIDHSVLHEDTPQIRGMVDLVRYLVRVEPADGGAKRALSAHGMRKKRSAPGAKRKAGIKPSVASRARRKRASRS
jgi:large subunit ribosomal protein L30